MFNEANRPRVPTPLDGNVRTAWTPPGPYMRQDTPNGMTKLTFLLKSVFIVGVRFELTTNDPFPSRRRHTLRSRNSPLGSW